MIEREERQGVVVLRMAHKKASALDLEFATSLGRTLHEIEEGAPRAVILTGTGNIFSAGVDLFRVLDGGAEYLREFLPATRAFFEGLFFFPLPVVAAVNGHAVAGGCVMACAADYRIMAAGTGTIGVPELQVGVPFPNMALEIMRFAAPQRFQELVYGGRTYLPVPARDAGLVDEVVEEAQLMERALALASNLDAGNPASFRLCKEQMRRPVRDRLKAAADLDQQVEATWQTPESLAAIQRYVDRTLT